MSAGDLSLTIAERALLDRLTAEQVVPLAQGLVSIPSVGAEQGEGAVADYIAGDLAAHGIAVERQEVLPGRPNVIGTLGHAGGRRLLFNAHMDVVPAGRLWTRDPFGGELEGDILYGRGAADDKGPLAASLAPGVALHESGLPLRGQLVLCAVMDEENASAGSKYLMRTLRGDMGIVCEATAGDLVIAHKGSLRPVIKA